MLCPEKWNTRQFLWFFSWNFVKEADYSRILEEIQKDFTDTIWFLWPLFLKNFDRNFVGILQEFLASANISQICIEYHKNNPMRLQKNSNSIAPRNWKSVASHPLESRKNLGLKVSNYPPPLIIIFPSNQKNWAVLVGDLENSSKLIKMFLTRPQWGQSFSGVAFDYSCIFPLTNQFPIYLGNYQNIFDNYEMCFWIRNHFYYVRVFWDFFWAT